jgi:FkbM family methyltransferase
VTERCSGWILELEGTRPLAQAAPLALAQTVLRRLGLYRRVQASALYDMFWMVTDRRVLDARQAELRFYRHVLNGFRPGHLIFDIGANHGAKTDIFLRMGARVVAVDPDEANEKVLRATFQELRWRPKPVVIVPKAVSDRETVETMWIDEPGSAKNTLNPKWVQTLRSDSSRFGAALEFSRTREVPTTTLEQLMTTYGMPFFIKIDVEGLEPLVLNGMQRRVPYLSFEVNLPEFKPEGLQCVERLYRVAEDGEFNFVIDCRSGLALSEWLPADAFSAVIDGCGDESIEVFWRTSGRPAS